MATDTMADRFSEWMKYLPTPNPRQTWAQFILVFYSMRELIGQAAVREVAGPDGRVAEVHLVPFEEQNSGG